MQDFANFVAGTPHSRGYQKIAGPSAWSTTDSIVYLADGAIYKRFLDSSETSDPVTRETLETYHAIHMLLSRKPLSVKVPIRKIEVEVSILPLEQADIGKSGRMLISKSPFVPGKTLSEESIPFEGKYGSLGVFVLENIRKNLVDVGVCIDTHDSYIHPTNIKVSPDDYTKLTITDLGSKIPAFVHRNGYLVGKIIRP